MRVAAKYQDYSPEQIRRLASIYRDKAEFALRWVSARRAGRFTAYANALTALAARKERTEVGAA